VPAVEAMIEETWRQCTAKARRDKQVLFNGLLVRLDRWWIDEGHLRLHTGPTDYRRFMGTNFCNGARIGEFGPENYANPLGVSAVVITSDGWLVLGRRRSDLACHGGYLHLVGGTLDSQDRTPEDTLDVFAAMRRELAEELCVTNGELAEVVCTGLIRDPSIHQPELMFDAGITLCWEELLARFDQAAPGQEHSALELCPDDSAAIGPFVGGSRLIAPIAVGGLLLHGRHQWGLEWYRRTCLGLFSELPPELALADAAQP
jgi:8-oxo-dGTP pyrophosphatase MutT (NUDIX family)